MTAALSGAPGRGRLRVVDAGDVGAARSQSLWHALASAMPAAPEKGAPVLSLCRPLEPYVCLGWHHSLESIDLDACRRLGARVLRRRIGGGAVWIDADQLFFQITLPAERAPARIDRLYETLLAPAVSAFRALGLEARLAGTNDIAVGGRKVSGTGAGRIGEAVTVVGNVLFRFPHERMASVLALASEAQRRDCLELMRRHVASLADLGAGDVTLEAAKAALVEAYAAAFGPAEPDGTSTAEEREIAAWERRFADPAWLAGPPAAPAPDGSSPPAARRIKVRHGVWLCSAAADGVAVEAAVVDGAVERVRVTSARLDGAAAEMARRLAGAPARPDEVERRLRPFGEAARPVAALLAPCLAARG